MDASSVITAAKVLSNGENGEGKEMSDYERLRAQNIKRNNARLRSLGLISAREENVSNDLALGKEVLIDTKRSRKGNSEEESVSGNLSLGQKRKGSQQPKGLKREKPSTGSSTSVASRRSPRLLGLRLDSNAISDNVNEFGSVLKKSKTVEDTQKEREERVRECREARLRAAKEVAEAGVDVAASQNRTATYDHCLMRVQSMTHKGLANRVKAIERAAGKHCVVKMAIFKSCLQDEGLWVLAQLAGDALERLKAMLPPPE